MSAVLPVLATTSSAGKRRRRPASSGGITQPAVSLQVRQLERRFGLKLVERVGRRAGPTAAGLELLTHIRAIDTALARAEQAMTAHASQVTGRLRLGTGATACHYLLPPNPPQLRRRQPIGACPFYPSVPATTCVGFDPRARVTQHEKQPGALV
ncbi:LysR family transcriptional regulator, partial [Achromobacter ruhlandii]